VLKYIVRRLLAAIPVLLGLSVVLFAFVHLLPGDPVAAHHGQHATPELTAQKRAHKGHDNPH
jgi:ABC-type dipeptide/oligopeptide/nickel transport system permease component